MTKIEYKYLLIQFYFQMKEFLVNMKNIQFWSKRRNSCFTVRILPCFCLEIKTQQIIFPVKQQAEIIPLIIVSINRNITMIPVPDSVDFRQEYGGGILPVTARTARIPPLDMITVLLLSPSYHFSEFSRRIQPVRILVESHILSFFLQQNGRQHQFHEITKNAELQNINNLCRPSDYHICFFFLSIIFMCFF